MRNVFVETLYDVGSNLSLDRVRFVLKGRHVTEWLAATSDVKLVKYSGKTISSRVRLLPKNYRSVRHVDECLTIGVPMGVGNCAD